MASGQKDHVDEVIDGISNSEEKKLKKEDDLVSEHQYFKVRMLFVII